VEAAFAQCGATFLEPRAGGVWRLDLATANRHQLAQAGVRQIEAANMCTACHTEEWFSHRAEHGRTGRMGALIALRE
jgi:copper oxidase (laccase) domain-containing protein